MTERELVRELEQDLDAWERTLGEQAHLLAMLRQRVASFNRLYYLVADYATEDVKQAMLAALTEKIDQALPASREL